MTRWRLARPAVATGASEHSERRSLVFMTFVDGSPLDKLPEAIRTHGRCAQLFAMISADRWRAYMARGPLRRLATRTIVYVCFPVAAVVRAAISRNVVLVPTTNPLPLPFVLLVTKRLHRKPVVPLVYDLWPDRESRTPTPGTVRRFISAYVVRMNAYWLRNADGLVFIGNSMRAATRRQYGSIAPSSVVTVGADASEFPDASLRFPSQQPARDAISAERRDGVRPIAAYVGHMGRMHEVDTLIDGIRACSDNMVAQIVVAGYGVGYQQLAAAANQQMLAIDMRAPLRAHEWRELLIESDIAIVTLKSEATNTSLPSKLFSAMAAGNAILAIAPWESDLARVVRSHSIGLVVEPGDGDSFADSLRQLASDPQTLRDYQSAARRAAVEEYALDTIASQWEDFLQSVGF